MWFWLLLPLFGFLAGCSSNEVAASPVEEEAIPQDFTSDEVTFYNQLSAHHRRRFVSLTKEERDEAIGMTIKRTPKDALWAAAYYDVQTLSQEEQKLYHFLNEKSKRLFFILSPESSQEAARWSQKMDPNFALSQALQIDFKALSDEEMAFYQSLSPNNQLLYLSLSDKIQVALATKKTKEDPNKMVVAAEKDEVARLSTEEQNYFSSLSEEDQILYLSLTPDARGMAVDLVQGIDPNDAVDYVLALQS